MSWTVSDVMTKDVVSVGPEEDFKTVARLMHLHEVSALPVVDQDGKLVGIVSESDLLAKERERGANRPLLGLRWNEDNLAAARTAGDVMTSPAICIAPDATIPEAARLMYREAVKRLPVIDHNGDLQGIVSRADLLKTFTRSDESIRRDIIEEVLKKSLSIEPRAVRVDVFNGLVRLTGEVESKSLATLVVRMVERVEGTVAVDSKLTSRLDDSKIHVDPPARALQLSADER
ncbi:MAG TPA: CBS domain-containing protein [Candidatus Dormibacteraeota bacterium]|nr:CBS domain-containing protein [Candidatus Dormibacteraeota bacterium]